MSTFGKVANAIAGSVGKTRGETILAALKAAGFPPAHPDVLFAEWMVRNSGRIAEAFEELGIEPPAEGPGFYQRFKEAVVARLTDGDV